VAFLAPSPEMLDGKFRKGFCKLLELDKLLKKM
jgi:hypothetical protein